MKPPGLSAIDSRATADTRRVVVIIKFMRSHNSRLAFGIDEDARVSVKLRTSVVSVDRETLIAEMIAAHVGKTQLASSFEQQDVFAGFR
jgi:hypothetical protein